MRNFFLSSVAILTLSLTAGAASGQERIDKPSRPLRPVMQLKLEYSKQVLEGLALEDFEKVAKNAQALGLLSLESGWKIIQTEEYAKQSNEFRRTTNLISESARDKNLERAALGYVALTVRCIECHGYLRKQHPDRDTAPADQADGAKAGTNKADQ
jgi:hypothetical protein